MPFTERNPDKYRNFYDELEKWKKAGVCERCIKIVTCRPVLYFRLPRLHVFKKWEKEKRIGRKTRRPKTCGVTGRKTLSWQMVTDTWIEQDFIHCERNNNGNCLEKILNITGGKPMYIPAKYLRDKIIKEIYEKSTKEGYTRNLLGWMYGYSTIGIFKIIKKERDRRILAIRRDE